MTNNIKLFTAALAVVLVAGVTIFYACKKDTTGSNTEGSSKASISVLDKLYNQLPTPNFGNITVVNGEILQFESAEHHDQVYKTLNELCKAWMALFLQTYDTGDETALDATIARLGFDENLPLYKFLAKYGVQNSLVEKTTFEENQWLGRGGNGTPPSDSITQCPIEQTLLSMYHEYCIGNTICQLRPYGCEILIPTSKLHMLTQIRNMSVEELLSYASKEPPHGNDYPPPLIHVPEPFNLEIKPPVNPPTPHNPPPGGDCGCHSCYCKEYEKTFEVEHGTDHKFTLYYHFRDRSLDGKPKTTVTMKNYKLKNNEWVKDYSSFCRLDFSTKLYHAATLYDCVDKGRDGKTGNNTKVFSKSKSKTFNYNSHAITDDINHSYIACRHKGVEFKFTPRGEAIP